MTKYKHFETESGKIIMTAQFDGYRFGDRKFEGLMFQITVQPDGTLKASVNPEDEDYFSDFNTVKFLQQAEEYAAKNDIFEDPLTKEECRLVSDSPTHPLNIPQPITVTKASIALGQSPNTASSILEDLFPDKENETTKEEEVKEPVIGKFKPKRQFLNFVQGRQGGIRFHTNVAYIKSEKLTGTLDAIFKITICDEGTIDFEEMDTNLCDDAMIQRFIDDIDSRDVTGYMKKFVVYGLDFTDEDNKKLYLEVEYKKPIDKLFSLFDELKEPEKTEPEAMEVSDNAQSLLDSLFGDSDEVKEETTKEETPEVVETPKVEENIAQKMMREAFEKMNADKIAELSDRIEKKEKEITKYKLDIRQNESNLKTASEDVKVLYSRYESLKPSEALNGYVFFVSPETKTGVTLDQNLQDVVKQISPLLKLKEDAVIEYLTKGFFTIKIAKKGELDNASVVVDKSIYDKISKMDPMGKVSMTGNTEFEYRGDMSWHNLVDKMIRMGFEQEPDFDKQCGSPSYQSEDQSNGFTLTLDSNMNLTQSSSGMSVATVNTEKDNSDEKEHTTQFVQKEYLNYDTPTDIVIIGDGSNGGDNIMITDDETNFDLYLGGKKYTRKSSWDTFSSMGYISIMTLDEYKKFYESNKDILEDSGIVEGFIIPQFIGSIGVTSELNDKFSNDFEFNDYIQHQTGGTVGICLPEGTQFFELNEDCSLPVSILRDIKIDTLIK
jgi:hypothetical protein